MFTIVGADGKAYGPVSKEKVIEWIAGGRANLQTRALREGETEWKTLGSFPEFNVAAAMPRPAPVQEPTGAVPIYPPVPAMSTPTGATSTPRLDGTPKEIADGILGRTSRIDVFACLDRAFTLWKQNFLPLVGVTFVIYVITAVIGVIPILGPIASFVLSGVFYGGLYYYYLGKMRGEPREFGDAFAGFKLAFGPLVLVNIFMVLILAGVALVLIGPWIIAMVAGVSINPESTAPLWLIPGIIFCTLPIIYLSIAWAFAPILVIDQGFSPWQAMEVSRRVVSKQWFRVFFTLLLGGLAAALGLIALIVGVFFTMPLAVGAITCAYEDMFVRGRDAK